MQGFACPVLCMDFYAALDAVELFLRHDISVVFFFLVVSAEQLDELHRLSASKDRHLNAQQKAMCKTWSEEHRRRRQKF